MELKKFREAKGYTQKQIADIIGVRPHTVCMYEKGQREPNLKSLKTMAQVLGCSVDELLSDI